MKLRRQLERRTSNESRLPVQVADAPVREETTDAREAREPNEVLGEDDENTDTSVREFTDDAGRIWRAWPVIPGQSQSSVKRRGILGDFQNGWICFEGVNIAARRRFPFRPAGWASITDQELRRLLEESIDATAPISEQKKSLS
jgi:hypothetical protein